MNTPRTTLYRDSMNGKLLGVCAGIADYTGVQAIWVRLAAIFLTFAVSGLTIPMYIAAGILLSKKPAHLYTAPDETQYWQRVRQSPKRTAREIRARMKDIDRRLADVETYYVSANPRLSQEIERLR
ncbi:envelope stress response membrane protein PspC [Erythrobacter westpacificensis]|uniref:Envelope stress response membrane protein PspC n=1 Tax=Erythrobacter westpacificensis TaxID=1055231 RepID=A0ABP9KKQ1_9SPHN|tara:strand:- start:904 stop:1281 length:378 start_codon:yes stop_codon:yes gene_type:complete